MNDLSNTVNPHQNQRHCYCSLDPIPVAVIYILVPLFILSLSLSLFILIFVHNLIFFISILLLFSLIFSFLFWNLLIYRRKGAVLIFLDSFPLSDLSLARHGQLVKITGSVSCGSVSLESSYEKVPQCVYTSTCFYEYARCTKLVKNGCFRWSLAYSQRFSTDFWITDAKSGTRATVKAGYGAKVIPLIRESTLVNTTSKHGVLSPHLKNWLGEKNLSLEARLLRLEEGYVKEGSPVTVVGLLHRNDDFAMIVQPPEIISTGCLWKKLLLPVDIQGLIIQVPQNTGHQPS